MNTPTIPPARLPAPEAVEQSSRWACEGGDFGLLHSLPLVIPASLVLWAVIAAAWIALL